MRGLLFFLLLGLAAMILEAGPTGAERKWLAKFLRADDKEARILLRKYPGGRCSLERAEALLAAGLESKALKPGMHHLTFESGKETWKYTVSIPRGYDGKKRFPVVMDAGHGSLKDQNDDKAAQALAKYLLQVRDAVIGVRPRIFDKLCKDGRYDRLTRSRDGEAFRTAAPLFRDLLRVLRLRLAVDGDRFFLTGISMSGYWAWRLGADLPGEWAGIIPISAVTHQVQFGMENFQGLPVFILHSRDDPRCPFRQARDALDKLEALKAPVGHHFLDRGGHVAPFNHFSRGWAWMAGKKRDTAPRKIRLRLQRSTLGPVHWIEVLDLKSKRFIRGRAGAEVDAEVIEGNRVQITARNVRSLRLHLSPKLLDLGKAVKVKVNGKTVHTRKVKPSGKAALEEARKRGDTGIFYPASLLIKP